MQLASTYIEGSIYLDYSLPLETVLLLASVSQVKVLRELAFFSIIGANDAAG
jgi:hypothetical protein